MMRRSIIWVAVALIIVAILVVSRPEGLGFKPRIDASASVLLDMDSDSIWMESNGDKAMPTASVTKLMTEMIVLDRISTGAIHWADRITVSPYAGSLGGATLSLKRGETYTVRELFEGITVYSANDAAVALAEYTAGSENAFVVLMNEKARSLGLSSGTVFTNASGLASSELGPSRPPGYISGETLMTAKDTARLAAALIRSHPEVLNASSRTQMQLKAKGMYASNTNLMLPAMGGAFAYAGTDGLKTGYDIRSGYCIAGTAQRDGHRLIAVVLGAETSQSRFEAATKLFNHGFYRSLPTGERVKHVLNATFSLLSWR
ncbi:D-alanyl-D-alanine carboxypeptidase family protein [Paenibacillus sp. NPDC058177]|uniref:D-alanyl-D-alanine carboxypeptidase family protein n=1 Tax=Paenibacillus sp. NPDC058177 TaxID=3346369 RepID=UPI0036DF9ACE